MIQNIFEYPFCQSAPYASAASYYIGYMGRRDCSKFFFPRHSLSDFLAVGSGFGYYSLSSIFITEYRGAELGTIALLANIVRELIVLLCAPLLVKFLENLLLFQPEEQRQWILHCLSYCAVLVSSL